MARETEDKIAGAGISLSELIYHVREKCRVCGHHRIMHSESGGCEGVMNKPCMSGCDMFEAE